MTPKKEERMEKEEAWEISKLKPIWTKMERKREKKTRTHCIKCTPVYIANLVLHIGFPLKSWLRNYGQLSWNKLTQTKEGFLPWSRLAEGILIKFPRLLPLNRKSSPLQRTLRLTRKSILIKKQNMWCKCYSVNIYFTCLQSKTACAQYRQWPAWLEFIQLHFPQLMILHAVIPR